MNQNKEKIRYILQYHFNKGDNLWAPFWSVYFRKNDEILEKIKQDRHISSHDVAYELNIHHQTVLNHFQKAEFKKKLDVWAPHELSVKNKIDRHTQTSLMTRQKLRELDWEVLMQNSLHGTKLASRKACENHFIQFFTEKNSKTNHFGSELG